MLRLFNATKFYGKNSFSKKAESYFLRFISHLGELLFFLREFVITYFKFRAS